MYLAPPPPVRLKCPLRHRLSSCSLISFVPRAQPQIQPASQTPRAPRSTEPVHAAVPSQDRLLFYQIAPRSLSFSISPRPALRILRPAPRPLSRSPLRSNSPCTPRHILLSLVFVQFSFQFRLPVFRNSNVAPLHLCFNSTRNSARPLSIATRNLADALCSTPKPAHTTPSQPSLRHKLQPRRQKSFLLAAFSTAPRRFSLRMVQSLHRKNICLSPLFSSAFSCATISPVH